MTVIRTSCTDCFADLEMGPTDVHLVVHDRGDNDFYEFICPCCSGLIRKPADVYVVKVLRFGQVPETRMKVPDEMFDSKREQPNPITYDDLLDLVVGLRELDSLPADFR